MKIEIKRTISAPVEIVFQTISDVRNFSKAVPNITNIEFLTDKHSGKGTRFIETRVMNGKEHSVELEVADLVENELVRMVSDAGGTVWDTVFTVKPAGANSEMNMAMEARPYKLVAKIMNRFIGGMVSKGVTADMDAVKEYCESQTAN